jgi:hypothetical protein
LLGSPGYNPEENNSCGFNGLASGAFGTGFRLMGAIGFWHCTTLIYPDTPTRNINISVRFDLQRPSRTVGYTSSGLSVRCVKD